MLSHVDEYRYNTGIIAFWGNGDDNKPKCYQCRQSDQVEVHETLLGQLIATCKRCGVAWTLRD